VCHVTTDRLPGLGDDENLPLRQRDLDGFLEFGQTETPSVLARHRPLTRSTRRPVTGAWPDVHRARHAADRDSHLVAVISVIPISTLYVLSLLCVFLSLRPLCIQAKNTPTQTKTNSCEVRNIQNKVHKSSKNFNQK